MIGQACVVQADFTDAVLCGVNLRGADLRNTNFTGANLEGATLSDTKLAGACFTGALLTGSRLDGARLEGADFKGAILDPELRAHIGRRGGALVAQRSKSDPLPDLLRDHKLWLDSSGRQGVRADLSDRDLNEADLRGLRPDRDHGCAVLPDLGAQLHRTVLAMADLSFADLRDAQMSYADLRGAEPDAGLFCPAPIFAAPIWRHWSAHTRPDRQWPTNLEIPTV